MMNEDEATGSEGELEAVIAVVMPAEVRGEPDIATAESGDGGASARRATGIGLGLALASLALLTAALWYALMRPQRRRRTQEQRTPRAPLAQPTLSGWGRAG